jgi:ornithine--oxo-acid transaminase
MYHLFSKVQEFKKDKNICGYLLEPILAEGGMFFPAVDYLTKVKQLCEKYKVQDFAIT